MPKLNIVGWREGLLKISMVHVLQDHLSLSLTEAKATVDAIAAGKRVSFPLNPSVDAAALRAELERVGAIVELQTDDEPLRVSAQGET
jgi:ribosomal protein L7/L12